MHYPDEPSESTRRARIEKCGYDAILTWINRKSLLKSFLRAFLEKARDEDLQAELYLVGGSVRDILEGKKEIKDIDLMVSGLSFTETEKILSFLKSDKSLRIREVTNAGKHFPVFKVSVRWPYQILPLDVALARSEISTGRGHRDFEVTTGVRSREDSMRRDFTINAIFFRFTLSGDDLSGVLVDYQNGIDSLVHREIRAVGTPQARFTEDPLRMLRAIRQKNERPGFVIERKTWEAICELMPILIQTISRERIAEELVRSLRAAPAQTFRDWRDSGAFRILIPELSSLDTDTENKTVRTLEILEKESPGKAVTDTVLIAALLSEIALFECNEKKLNYRMRNNAGRKQQGPEFYRFYQCIKPDIIARRMALPHLKEVSALLHDLTCLDSRQILKHKNAVAERILSGYTNPDSLIALYQAVQRVHGSEMTDFSAFLERTADIPHIIDGQDLLDEGIPPGPSMSFILEGLRERELTGEVTTRNEALALSRELYTEFREYFTGENHRKTLITRTGGSNIDN